MKSKITSTGLFNEIKHIDFATENNISSPDKNLVNPSKLSELFPGNSKEDSNLASRAKKKHVSANGITCIKVTFRIAILNHLGFFNDFRLCIDYSDANNAFISKTYLINASMKVIACLYVDEVLDLSQVCLSVRSKDGKPLKITVSSEGLESVEELKVDFASLKELTLYVNDHLNKNDGAQRPIGWISYNTQNIFH